MLFARSIENDERERVNGRAIKEMKHVPYWSSALFGERPLYSSMIART